MPLDVGIRLQALVEADEPFALIWQWMVELGQNAARGSDTARFYEQYEKALAELERAIHDCYVDLYGMAAEACREHSVSQWVKEAAAETVVFCDGFSVREAVLLANQLQGTTAGGREVRAQIRGFKFCNLPSDTGAWRASLWPDGRGNRATEDFGFYELRPREQVMSGAFSRRTVVWYPLPDHGLHQTEPRYGTTAEEVFDRLARDMEQLVEQLPPGTALITGDHGYIYVPRAALKWDLPGAHRTNVRKLFGDKRSVAAKELDGAAREIGQRWKWYGIYMLVDDSAVLLGRYWLPRKGAPMACHGGISLTECLVPVLEITIE